MCGTVMHMDSIRTQKISVNLTPEQVARLDSYAARHHWSRSTAAAVLIDSGLNAADDAPRDAGTPS
jgi:hypothetical protein